MGWLGFLGALGVLFREVRVAIDRLDTVPEFAERFGQVIQIQFRGFFVVLGLVFVIPKIDAAVIRFAQGKAKTVSAIVNRDRKKASWPAAKEIARPQAGAAQL